jgi:hypothetical protein
MQEVQRHRVALLSSAAVIFAACQAVIELVMPVIDRTPYHTSILSGEAWVQELLTGYPMRICNELGVYWQTFFTLVQTLQDIGIRSLHYVTIEEQVAIFLYTVVTELSSTHVGEHFQQSPGTIQKLVSIFLQYIVFLIASKIFQTHSTDACDAPLLHDICQAS